MAENNMKMILAGAWQWPTHQQICAEALTKLGVEVIPFKWGGYFQGALGKFEAHTLIGITRIPKLNNDLIELCQIEKPDVLFVWNAMHLKNETLEKIKALGVLLVSYNNDDPFSKRNLGLRYFHLKRIWRNFVKNLPIYHLNFVYRNKNIEDYRRLGIENVELLHSYYVPEFNYPLKQKRGVEYQGVFIGHYEVDERFGSIVALQDAGIQVKIFGAGWERCNEKGGGNLNNDIRVVHGPSYNQALNGAQFALCFFSKLNNDEYTRRVFEIPASGTLLVSKRTVEMESLYKDGEEAIFFDDEDELVTRMKKLLDEPQKLEAMARRGYQRCLTSGYDVNSRMKNMLKQIRLHLV